MALVKVVRVNEASSDVYGENQVTKWGQKNFAQKKRRGIKKSQGRNIITTIIPMCDVE